MRPTYKLYSRHAASHGAGDVLGTVLGRSGGGTEEVLGRCWGGIGEVLETC